MSNILPAVGLVTLLTAGAAVVTQQDSPEPGAQQKDFAAVSLRQEPPTVSRSAERPPLPNEAAAESKIKGQRFALTSLKVHAAARDNSPVLAKVDSGDTVDITGVERGDWAQIMHKGLPRWVTAAKLVKKMPKPKPKPLGVGACAGGSAVESGLQPDTIKVHRAVCAAFPSIVRWGGRSGGGEHATGRALDIMVSSDVGTQIADFVRAHAAALGVSQVIWRQRIWTVQRAGDGWRGMSSRGSATANHMDHVHVTTYGNAAR